MDNFYDCGFNNVSEKISFERPPKLIRVLFRQLVRCIGTIVSRNLSSIGTQPLFLSFFLLSETIFLTNYEYLLPLNVSLINDHPFLFK